MRVLSIQDHVSAFGEVLGASPENWRGGVPALQRYGQTKGREVPLATMNRLVATGKRLEGEAKPRLRRGLSEILPEPEDSTAAPGVRQAVGWIFDEAGIARSGHFDVSADCEFPQLALWRLRRTSAICTVGSFSLAVRCRRCESCRSQRLREWQARSYQELDRAGLMTFLTLTVDDGILRRWISEVRGWRSKRAVRKGGRCKASRPWRLLTDAQKNTYLRRRFTEQVQAFIRRLRNRWAGAEPLALSYVGIYEYGKKAGRLHLHLVLYGVAVPRQVCREAWLTAPRGGRLRLEQIGPWKMIRRLISSDGKSDEGRSERERCNCKKLGFIDVKRIGSSEGFSRRGSTAVIRYVTKYIAKEDGRIYASLWFGDPERDHKLAERRERRAELKRRAEKSFAARWAAACAASDKEENERAIAESTARWLALIKPPWLSHAREGPGNG